MSEKPTPTFFTEKEFIAELAELRRSCGDKRFWARKPEEREAYISGLGFMYLNLFQDDGSKPTPEQVDKWATWYQSAMNEYNRRAMYLEIGL